MKVHFIVTLLLHVCGLTAQQIPETTENNVGHIAYAPAVPVWVYSSPQYAIPSRKLTHSRMRIAPTTALTTSVLSVEEGRVLVNDRLQDGFVDLFSVPASTPWTHQRRLRTLTFGLKPRLIARLHDGSFASTFLYSKTIKIFTVNKYWDYLTIQSTIETETEYGGICAGPSADTLFVGAKGSNPRIDVIGMDGGFIRTLLANFTHLKEPHSLQTYGDYLYVSDWASHKFFRVSTVTGEVNWQMGKLNLQDLDLVEPKNFAIDGHGTVYLTTMGEHCNPDDQEEDEEEEGCILRITQDGDMTSILFKAPFIEQMSDLVDVRPYGVDVTDTQLLVTRAGTSGWQWISEVQVYQLDSGELRTPSPTTAASLV